MSISNVKRVDEPAKRDHPGVERSVQGQLVEQRGAADPEQVRHGHVHALLGQHGVDLGLEPGAQRDQLAPVPHRLPQSAHLGRGDPRLGQPAHPQQVGKITSVKLVVLDSAVRETLDPQGMRQMHGRTGVGQHVRSPVPAVRCFQHHLRALTPRGNQLRQLKWIVVDTNRRTKTLTLRRHPHNHATPPMQIYPDKLPSAILVHRASLVVVDVNSPSVTRG
jgi:hypothetical protein